MEDDLKPGPRHAPFQGEDDSAEKRYQLIGKTAASFIPLLGSVMSSVLEATAVDPAMRRRDAFLLRLEERIVRLSDRVGSLEALLNGHDVSALILQSVQISTRSMGQEKLSALENTVAKGIGSGPSEYTAALISLGVLDRCTSVHIQVLKLIVGMADTSGKVPWGAALKTLLADEAISEPHMIKRIALDDLTTLGLTSLSLDTGARHISQFSTTASENGSDMLTLTDLGRILYRHVTHDDVVS